MQSKTPSVGSSPTDGDANPATNQPTGVSVDGNGNTLGSSTPYNWDIENRLLSSSTATPATNYSYDAWGKRIWKQTITPGQGYGGGCTSACEFYFYSLGGQKLERMPHGNRNERDRSTHRATPGEPFFNWNPPGQVPAEI